MTIYGKGCISNYRNCSLSYVWYSVLYRMLTIKYIPRFILINKDFNIADAYAPRPSEDSIREKLEYLLK